MRNLGTRLIHVKWLLQCKQTKLTTSEMSPGIKVRLECINLFWFSMFGHFLDLHLGESCDQYLWVEEEYLDHWVLLPGPEAANLEGGRGGGGGGCG